jgi:hypothetical protein
MGGAFYNENSDGPLAMYDIIVKAWMPLPKPYEEEEH